MTVKLNAEQQKDVIDLVNNTIQLHDTQSVDYSDQMLAVYESLSTMEMPDTGDNLTRFKINKAHEVLRKVVPRVVANAPKFVITPRTDVFYDEDEWSTWAERAKILERNNKYSSAVRDYLHSIFKDEQFTPRLKIWAIKALSYWNSFAQVTGKYKMQRKKGENWVEEHVVWVNPTIEPVSWTEMKYDARYLFLEDMPWIVRTKKRVSLFSIMNNGDYFNLNKIKELSNVKYSSTANYTEKIFQISGVQDVEVVKGIDKNDLEVHTFEWYYSMSGEAKDSKLYEFVVVDWAVVIWAKEITQYSFVDMKAHEDPEVFYSTGLIAPIMGITDELNFQKNAQATAIGKSLNRSYYWSPDSWVDPSQLFNDKAWDIIVCNNGVENAMRNIKEMEDRQLPAQYFSNINDYNRDILTLSHTTDVSQPWGQWALTNTATWARISFFESNAVIAELRKNFERAVQELAYKLLDWTANNIDKDIVIKKPDSAEFIKINIEAIRDAVERYEINVEANSSSFDNLENRRADAIALKNIMIEWVNSGVDINMEEWFRKVFSTFPELDWDTLINKTEDNLDIESLLWGQQSGDIPKGEKADNANRTTTPEGLTQAVAWGDLLQ